MTKGSPYSTDPVAPKTTGSMNLQYEPSPSEAIHLAFQRIGVIGGLLCGGLDGRYDFFMLTWSALANVTDKDRIA